MISPLVLVLVLLAVAIVMFAVNKPRMDAVALIMLTALPFVGMLTGTRVVTMNEALAGFADANVVLIAALFATSLHFIMGPGGMHSFGHAAYFGLGAYGAGLLVKFLALSMPPALLVAPVVAGAGALLFGWFAVRLSGVYLAMLTLAFAQIVWSIAFQWDAVPEHGGELLVEEGKFVGFHRPSTRWSSVSLDRPWRKRSRASSARGRCG